MRRSTFLALGPGAACLVATTLFGCSGQAGGDLEATSSAQAPIEDGENDEDDLGVVRVVRPRSGQVEGDRGGQCSGVVIAPDLVLTARHCVSAVRPGESLCKGTTFYPVQRLTVELVGLTEAFESLAVPAENVAVPAEGDELCGFDLALVRVPGLADSVREYGVRVLEPRFGGEVEHGESYRAVGLGAYDARGSGVGTRRERGGLAVDCAGDGCESAMVGEREWRGSDAICSGDSGGPALDGEGRLIGIVSRANKSDCSKPVYASVFAWRGWLSGQAVEAARLGGYAPPPWAAASLVADDLALVEGDARDAGEGDEGCSAGSARPGRGGAWAAFALAAAALAGRCRRGRAGARG